MARIPQDEIDRIKRDVSVETLVRGRGIELRAHGANLLGLCPFHDDHEPSLVVTPAKNLWNCLGACQRGGSVIDWVMTAERVSFPEAVRWIGERYPYVRNEGREARDESADDVVLPCPIAVEMTDAEMLDAVTRFYHERLLAHGDARAYLEKRAIASADLIETFRLGFADRSLGTALPGNGTKAGVELRARLANLGLYREETRREHFRGCVTFPVFDDEGHVVEIYGRKIRDDIRHKHGSHMYLPGPHRGVWNAEGIRASGGTVILCEALIDAATFWGAGFRNVTAAYGVNGFTPEILSALKSSAVERVFIAYDRDEAGDKAARDLAALLARENIASWRVVFPRWMDANDYARKMKPATQALSLLLRAAEWMHGPKVRPAIGAALPAVLAESDAVVPEPPVVEAIEDARDEGQEAKEDDTHCSEVSGDLAAALPLAAEEEATKEESAIESQSSLAPQSPDRSLAVADYSTIDVTFGDRRYRVRGMEKNVSFHQLKVVLRVARGERVFLDTLDMVSARHRASVRQAGGGRSRPEGRESIKHDLARSLSSARDGAGRDDPEGARAEGIAAGDDRATIGERRWRCCRIRRSLSHVLARLRTVRRRRRGDEQADGATLAAVSRKLDDPLAIIIQSSSAAGKTTLMDAVLD